MFYRILFFSILVFSLLAVIFFATKVLIDSSNPSDNVGQALQKAIKKSFSTSYNDKSTKQVISLSNFKINNSSNVVDSFGYSDVATGSTATQQSIVDILNALKQFDIIKLRKVSRSGSSYFFESKKIKMFSVETYIVLSNKRIISDDSVPNFVIAPAITDKKEVEKSISKDLFLELTGENGIVYYVFVKDMRSIPKTVIVDIVTSIKASHSVILSNEIKYEFF